MAKKYNIKDKSGYTVLSFKGRENNSRLKYTIRITPTQFLVSFPPNPKINKKIQEFVNKQNPNRAPIIISFNEEVRILFLRDGDILLFVGNYSYTIRCPEIRKMVMNLIPEAEKLNFLLWLEEVI